jgi:predicted CXXCH cytochrome family protein
LTFFFDGVPPLEPLVLAAVPGEFEGAPPSPGARAKPRVSAYVSVHGPYAKRDCGLCHVSDFSNRLTQEGEDLCWSCHEREDFPGEVVHGPVAAGRCDGCHDPHRSRNPFLLVQPETALCEHCHDQETFARIDEHRAQEGDDCLRCHDPHASGREHLLKSDEDV